MDERLAELRRRLGEVSDLRSAQALLDWDQMVMMPPFARTGRQRSSGWPTNGSWTTASASS